MLAGSRAGTTLRNAARKASEEELENLQKQEKHMPDVPEKKKKIYDFVS